MATTYCWPYSLWISEFLSLSEWGGQKNVKVLFLFFFSNVLITWIQINFINNIFTSSFYYCSFKQQPAKQQEENDVRNLREQQTKDKRFFFFPTFILLIVSLSCKALLYAVRKKKCDYFQWIGKSMPCVWEGRYAFLWPQTRGDHCVFRTLVKNLQVRTRWQCEWKF